VGEDFSRRHFFGNQQENIVQKTESMNEIKVKVSRGMIGLFALSCLAAGAIFWYRYREDPTATFYSPLLNVGVLLGSIWIAFPKLPGVKDYIEVTPKGLAIVVASVFAIVMFPRLAVPGLIVFGVLWFFVKPRTKKR
jgi:hypothetical protein